MSSGNTFNQVDDELLALFVSLQLADLEGLTAGDLDTELAIQLYREELLSRFHPDTPGGLPVPNGSLTASPRSQAISRASTPGPAVGPNAHPFSAQAIDNVDCLRCANPVSLNDAVKIPCGHFYDDKCLIDLFLLATKDEAHMPASCCRQQIPLDRIRSRLSPEQITNYTKKEEEYSIPAGLRLYCPNQTCSAFISSSQPPSALASGSSSGPQTQTVTCEACQTRVCTTCKEREHAQGRCFITSIDEKFLELVQQSSYQRCSSCLRYVELTEGCYHITCRCGVQFCYLCGAKWKTCQCSQFAIPQDIPQGEPLPIPEGI